MGWAEFGAVVSKKDSNSSVWFPHQGLHASFCPSYSSTWPNLFKADLLATE
jgi:hypothetical protein